MVSYLVRRVLLGMVTLLVITALVYALIRFMPGTPLTVDLAESDPNKQMSPQDLKLATEAYGLDKPWYIAYWQWLGKLAQFDLGRSFRYRTSVTTLIGERIGWTLLLSVPAFVITYVLSVPLGLYATRRSGRFDERFISVLLYMLYSLPTYVAALWLLNLFYLRLNGTPFELTPGMYSDGFAEFSPAGKVLDIGKHLILPLICYSYGSLAYDTRFIKANMEEAIRQDYIRTARAKGLDDTTILWRHAFRNTLIPFVTVIGLTLPSLIGGAIILEQIFSWNGIGRLYYDALTFRDYPVIMGLTFIFSATTLAGQLFADFLYALVDPRVTYN